MRTLTSKDGDLLSFFEKSNEKINNDTALKHTFITNHTTAATKVKLAANCHENIFLDFVRLSKK